MKRPPVVAGLVFVTLGTVLLLDRAGAIADGGALLADWWPLAVIAAGIGQAVLPPRSPGGGIVTAAIGGALLLWTQDVLNTPSLVLPVLLIALGLWLIVGRDRGPHDPERLEEHVSVTTVFGDRDLQAARGPFRGGDVTTVFGDVDLDLRHATADGEVTLQATTVFGDLDLVIPDSWRVRVTGPQMFGDVQVADPVDPMPDGPLLVLRMTTIFGDVEVRRVASNVAS